MDNREVSIGDWILTMILTSIPVVNIIMLCIWAFGGENTPASKRNRRTWEASFPVREQFAKSWSKYICSINRIKNQEELFYHRGKKTEHYTMEKLKFMVWRYFMSYWSNRKSCSAISEIPPAVKQQRFYAAAAIVHFASKSLLEMCQVL